LELLQDNILGSKSKAVRLYFPEFLAFAQDHNLAPQLMGIDTLAAIFNQVAIMTIFNSYMGA